MGLDVSDRGSRNRLEIDTDTMRGDLKIDIRGSDNRLRIGPGLRLVKQARLLIAGNDNVVELGERVRLQAEEFRRIGENYDLGIRGSRNRLVVGADVTGRIRAQLVTDGAALEIGAETTIVDVHFTFHEPRRITLGRGCMLAARVWMTVSDMHSVIDLETGERLNPAQDIVVGDRVWLGYDTKVLKGAVIGAGAIIGTGSVVTGVIPPNCMAAGYPARVLRENVTWRRPLIGLAARATSELKLKG